MPAPRWVLLAAAVLVTSLVMPAAATARPSDDPTEPTQPVLVQADDGSLVQDDVTDDELTALRSDPSVGPVVTRGHTVEAEMAQSVPLVGAPTLWADGYTGADEVVVIIDTGVGSGFGGTLVGQACFAANSTGEVGYCGPEGGPTATQAFDSTCFTLGVCHDSDPYFVPDPAAGRPCTDPDPDAPENCAHGTAVAAVAARHDSPSGVAPDAGVYAIKVFNPQGTSADLFDILLGLDHARQLAEAGMPIAAVNLSLATRGTTFSSACDDPSTFGDYHPAYKELIDDLGTLGIPVTVASGNDGRRGSISFPACISSAVSVGASDLDDDLADFGNRGPGLDLVAPGADEGNGPGDPMEIPGSPVLQWAGTSFSAPHVAGAFAVLAQQYPPSTAAQRRWLAKRGGVSINDTTGASYTRLRLRQSKDILYGGSFVPLDTIPAGGQYPRVGDFNGDGVDDLLSYTPGSVTDRITHGTAGWDPHAQNLPSTPSCRPAVGQFVGDVDGPDDIALYGGAGCGRLWSGQSDGSFDASSVALPTASTSVVGDLDGDGWDDLLLIGVDQVRYGGASGFSAPFTLPVSNDALTVVAQVDADPTLELVHHRPGSTPDRLWSFTGRGTFTSSIIALGSSSSLAGRPFAADLDGDGDDDLVLVRSDGTGVRLLASGGAFGPPTPTPAGAIGRASVGHVDANASEDIVFHGSGSKPDVVWYGSASGAPTPRALSISGSYTPVLADLDGNGRDDLVLYATGSSNAIWWSWGP